MYFLSFPLTHLHMADHPEETLGLVRFDLRVQQNVFAEQIIRHLQTSVTHPVLSKYQFEPMSHLLTYLIVHLTADLMETPEREVAQR